MKCPYCGQHKVEVITQIDPMSFNYHEITKTVCMFCGKVIEPTEKVTYSNSTDSSYTKATSVVKYCDNCNTKLEPFGNDGWWICPKCNYGYKATIGDPPVENVSVWSGSTGVAISKLNDEDLMNNTLQFDRCEKIIFRDKTLDFVFEIPDERYKDIDTIIVNGVKFVRESNGAVS